MIIIYKLLAYNIYVYIVYCYKQVLISTFPGIKIDTVEGNPDGCSLSPTSLTFNHFVSGNYPDSFYLA